MGVKGLTTFILSRQHLFFDQYDCPHSSSLVIDGPSLATNIYKNIVNNCNWFGGDYEIYVEAIEKFFQMLSECKVIPYVLMDGATEERKLDTVMNRLKDRLTRTVTLKHERPGIKCKSIIKSEENQKAEFYPLFTTEVFRSVLEKLNIPMVICDFECDWEVANIAKKLDCPVLSDDSDFFIFDVKYIPYFLHFQNKVQNLSVIRKLEMNSQKTRKELNLYLRCKIFNRKKFLKQTGLIDNVLPVLTVYLGNDFISRLNDLPEFFRHLKIWSGDKIVNSVGTMIDYLKGKNRAEAIKVMLDYYKEEERNILKNLVYDTIKGYECRVSKYMKYLVNIPTEDENYDDDDDYLNDISEHFVLKYRQGYYHHHFLNILLFNRYCPKPMLEEIDKVHCHTSSFSILSAIHKILTNDSNEKFVVYGRNGMELCKLIVSKCEKNLPNIEEIHEMNLSARFQIFTEILNIEQKFVDECLPCVPKSWKMFLITLKYLSVASTIELSLVHSLILCKIVLTCIDKKIGMIRYWDDLNKCEFEEVNVNKNVDEMKNISQAFYGINHMDSYHAMRSLIPYFHESQELQKDETLFDRSLIHGMSEFQSCLLHITMLNDLFNRPYENCDVYECYNGTFIYNMFDELKKDKVNVSHLLSDSPTVLEYYEYVCNLVKAHLEFT